MTPAQIQADMAHIATSMPSAVKALVIDGSAHEYSAICGTANTGADAAMLGLAGNGGISVMVSNAEIVANAPAIIDGATIATLAGVEYLITGTAVDLMGAMMRITLTNPEAYE